MGRVNHDFTAVLTVGMRGLPYPVEIGFKYPVPCKNLGGVEEQGLVRPIHPCPEVREYIFPHSAPNCGRGWTSEPLKPDLSQGALRFGADLR